MSYYKLDKDHSDGEIGSPHGRFTMINEKEAEITPAEARGLNIEKEESNLFEMIG